ncbi:hypothetical protein pdam_00015826 [Pocillopora damicornis]|uniref:Uncharacterized protein n=1 Tax=Pocillopora damicornis TaxID=46731 RepID=A0A3M6T5P4_POCDA|nr:hypothetical protein pdam_00015826 [Pocillopora damicornis]
MMRIVWQTVRRITVEILGVNGLIPRSPLCSNFGQPSLSPNGLFVLPSTCNECLPKVEPLKSN